MRATPPSVLCRFVDTSQVFLSSSEYLHYLQIIFVSFFLETELSHF